LINKLFSGILNIIQVLIYIGEPKGRLCNRCKGRFNGVYVPWWWHRLLWESTRKS